MKTTAVDWLIEQLTPSISLQQKHIDDLKEKAKEMEKQQIIDAWNDVYGHIKDAEQYYTSTYGSKGSETTSSQTDENGKPLTYWGGLDKSPQTTSDKWKEYQDWLNEVPELSDDEIEKAARNYDNAVIYGPPLLHFEQGAFWYREQLKNKA